VKIIRTIASLASSLALMVGFTISSAAPASAVTLPDCPSGRVCIWDGANFTGSELTMTSPGTGQCKTIPYAWAKNMASSFFNNTGHTVWWYDPDSCGGAPIMETPNGAVGNVGSAANNKINSFYVCATCQ